MNELKVRNRRTHAEVVINELKGLLGHISEQQAQLKNLAQKLDERASKEAAAIVRQEANAIEWARAPLQARIDDIESGAEV